VINRYVGNLAPMPGVFPDYKAPIVRNGPQGRELATARWGMPSSSKALMDATKKRAEKLQAKGNAVDFNELLRMEPDGGTTNIRNVKSKHWTRWLGVENRCVVPFNSFSEFNKVEGGDIWFALGRIRGRQNRAAGQGGSARGSPWNTGGCLAGPRCGPIHPNLTAGWCCSMGMRETPLPIAAAGSAMVRLGWSKPPRC
jgi:hypothetical protein